MVEVALGIDRRETISLEQHQSCSCQCKVKVMMMMSDDLNDDASKQSCKSWHRKTFSLREIFLDKQSPIKVEACKDLS